MEWCVFRSDQVWQMDVDREKTCPEGWTLSYGAFAHGNAETETMNGDHRKSSSCSSVAVRSKACCLPFFDGNTCPFSHASVKSIRFNLLDGIL